MANDSFAVNFIAPPRLERTFLASLGFFALLILVFVGFQPFVPPQTGSPLAAASTAEGEKAGRKSGGNVAAAKEVGKAIAERAKSKGVTKVVFDRGGYIYHGRVKALADAAREAGLQF